MHGHGKLATIPAGVVGYLGGVDGAVEQRWHGVAAHPDVHLHGQPLEPRLHLRCLHTQLDHDPYMSELGCTSRFRPQRLGFS